MLYTEFPLSYRHILGTRSHKSLLRFEKEVMVFLKDAWVGISSCFSSHPFPMFHQKMIAPIGELSSKWYVNLAVTSL